MNEGHGTGEAPHGLLWASEVNRWRLSMEENARIESERSYWEGLSPKYDRFMEKRWKIYPALLDRIRSEVEEGAEVVEVAAGTGLVTLALAGKAGRIRAVDISPGMIREAGKKAEENGVENVEFTVGDAYALPFADDSFDTAICNNALHNMVHPERALSEMRRGLKPGSTLVAVVVGFRESRMSMAAMWVYELFGKLPVFHKMNADRFADLVRESGFRVEDVEVLQYKKPSMPLVFVAAELPPVASLA